MSRRGTAEKRTAKTDPIFRSRLVNMVVNRIMKDGKKSLAYQIPTSIENPPFFEVLFIFIGFGIVE